MNLRVRHLAVVVLTLALLLTAAMPAWAQGNSMTPTAGRTAIGETATYQIFFDTFVSAPAINELKDKNVTLKFPSGFDVSGLNGKTLDVVVEDATTAQKDYMQPVASVSGQDVTVNLPAAAFKNTTGGNTPKITFNGVTVKNPATVNESPGYTVELWLEGKTSAIATVNVSISDDYPKTVSITALSPTTVKIGGTFNIEVEVKNLTDQPLSGANVSVDIPGVLSSLQPLGSTNALGKVSGTVVVPVTTKPGTYQVVATAGGVSSAAQTITVTAGDPTKIEFVDENSQPVNTSLSGTVGQRQKLTVALFDAQGNLTAASSDLVVVLSARDANGNLAGKFYNAATGGSEIDRVTIPAGQSKVDFWFAPSLTGGNVTATVQGVTGWTQPTISFTAAQVGNITGVSLSAVPIYTSSATCGYAFKTTVSLNAIADKDYTVKVEFGSGDEGTWDTVFNPSLVGAKKSGDTFTIPAGSQSKTVYIYPKSSGTFDVTVTLVGTSVAGTINYTVAPATNNTKPGTGSMGPGWVVISTPVELAGNGDFKALFGLTDQNVNDYIASILTYENGSWGTVSSSTKLEPLKAYFVKLKRPCTATYFFKVNTSPSVPAERALAAGWNLVGVSAPIGSNGALDVDVAVRVYEPELFNSVADSLLTAIHVEYGTVYVPGAERYNAVTNGGAYWVCLKNAATIRGLALPPYVAE